MSGPGDLNDVPSRPNFEGIAGSSCEHRTVGPDRAWCLDCREWCYPNIPCVRCVSLAPVDWPARFRIASDAARRQGFGALAAHLAETAQYLQLPGRVEAIERALLGETDR